MRMRKKQGGKYAQEVARVMAKRLIEGSCPECGERFAKARPGPLVNTRSGNEFPRSAHTFPCAGCGSSISVEVWERTQEWRPAWSSAILAAAESDEGLGRALRAA